MKAIALLGLLVLAGCGEPLSNERIIAVANQCKGAGLVMDERRNWKSETVAVQCRRPIYW